LKKLHVVVAADVVVDVDADATICRSSAVFVVALAAPFLSPSVSSPHPRASKGKIKPD